ncbi:REP-associated tyrosine transposase [Jannaschia sp. LMIT008]|uniref:REP-associated tyrosine transposase n=1 Tax=Jannaschia maritima TaxID=3032585 RepID=UPI0028124F8F|nr:transposase [Jannaschia sp. LMIT008]
MPDYRRFRHAGHSYFFTVALADRTGTTLTDEVCAFRDAWRRTQAERPFTCPALVILPDHLHAIWTLPDDDSDFPTRWQVIKARFTHALNVRPARSDSKARRRERGIWQRRYFERMIRDEAQMRAAVAYCWTNPVRHGLVQRPVDWPHSSFHDAVAAGDVPPDWTGWS